MDDIVAAGAGTAADIAVFGTVVGFVGAGGADTDIVEYTARVATVVAVEVEEVLADPPVLRYAGYDQDSRLACYRCC